ncbi:MAG TPA: 30S ribosomal protein S19 [Candidatus Omnitrophica bacterium]|nr:30S ribosomal protein S19 [Candidatus Omnitrophota bacterium]
MSRSIKKGPYVHPKILKKVELAKKTKQRQSIKIWSRSSMILPEFVGMHFNVHNGKTFVPIFVTEKMVGHRFGEFAPTRTFRKHGAHTERSTAIK